MSEEILAAFAAETTEILEALESDVAAFEDGDPGAVGRLFRHVHTLKGSAGIVGMRRAEAFAHAWETRLGRIRSGAACAGESCATGLLACRERFSAIVSSSRPFEADSETAALLPEDEAALALLDAALESPSAGGPSPGPDSGAAEVSAPAAPASVPFPAPENPSPEPPGPSVPASGAGPPAPAPGAPGSGSRPGGEYDAALESFARVPRRKLDRILSLASELVVSLSNLGREGRGGGAGGEPLLDDALGVVEGLASQLYRAVLETRMVPVSDVVERYRRAVGEIARHSRKRIRFEVVGGETEIDKPVSDRLAEPLLHLVRNAADHGVEPPEERKAAGKPEEATVRFSARREPGYLEIRVADDGRGIPLDKVRAKAVEAGLVPAEGPLERERLLDCLFEPGFTLAEKVTRWSGRGVGLDAVRGALKALRGEVRMETEEGRGSAAVLRIPVSLSLVEGFVARAGEYRLLVPFDTVESCDRFRDPAGGAVFRQVESRGRLRACVDLSVLYGGAAPPGERVVIAVRSASGEAGVLVDEVGETLTATVRGVDRKPGEAPGIAGSAILGDGRLLLVLDTEEICRLGTAGGDGGKGPSGRGTGRRNRNSI